MFARLKPRGGQLEAEVVASQRTRIIRRFARPDSIPLGYLPPKQSAIVDDRSSNKLVNPTFLPGERLIFDDFEDFAGAV